MPPLPEDCLVKSAALKTMGFRQACEAWLESRLGEGLADKTIHEYRLIINTLAKTFGMFTFMEIDADLIRKFQKQRQSDGVGPSGVNHECSVLQQILKRIGRWTDIAPDYHPIKLPKWKPGRIIDEIQRERLMRISQTDLNWEAAYYFAQISVETTAGPKELYTLRLQDVNLGARTFMVGPEGAKRRERVRTLDLSDDAFPAMVKAVARAQRLGSKEDHHYLFPAINRNTQKYDPTKHQGSFKTAWKKMTAAAGLPGLKMYDLRRTAITDLLTDGRYAEETVIQIAGHVGRDMLKHYSYFRRDKVREALTGFHKKKLAMSVTVEKKPRVVDKAAVRRKIAALMELLDDDDDETS